MKKTPTYPRRSQDAFVSQRMLYNVRDELKEHVGEAEARLMSEIHGLKSENESIHSILQAVKSDIHELKGEVHRVALLVEEQNNRNKIVLDGLTHMIGRQDRLENEWIEFRK